MIPQEFQIHGVSVTFYMNICAQKSEFLFVYQNKLTTHQNLVAIRLCHIPRSAYCVDSPLQTNFTWCKMLRKNFRNIIYLPRIAIVFLVDWYDLIHNSHVETQFSLQKYVKFAAKDKTLLIFVFNFHHNVFRIQCFKQETESFAAFSVTKRL